MFLNPPLSLQSEALGFIPSSLKASPFDLAPSLRRNMSCFWSHGKTGLQACERAVHDLRSAGFLSSRLWIDTFSAERSIDFFSIKIWRSRSDLQRQFNFLHMEQIKVDDSKLEKASQRAAACPCGPVYLATSTYDVKKRRQFGEGRDFLALII